jgi:eukaryotic-like serine/threonine-protein kinase
MTGEQAAHTPLRPSDPRRLGGYELLGRLGEGGMGTVYLARDRAGTLVAVKMVRADLAPDDEFRRRFRSEVNRVRQVPPFCTAEVLDADPDHDPPYLVVEYVDGPSLAEVVNDRGPLTAANLHGVAIGVATALSAIHGAGIIHRDLKPRNVLLAPGSPKVIDFGIARALEATSQHTRTDQMVGTVAYMAPERFGSEPGATLTPAADIFAWGAVVAYAGTGRTPFSADSPTATAARILTQPPDLSGLSGTLRDLIGYTLEKDPVNRPTARELLDLLVTGPHRPAATAAALAHQPGLRAAAQEARAATGFEANRQLTAVATPPHLARFADRTAQTQVVDPEAFRGPPLRGPLPRRRRLLPTLIVLMMLLAAGGAAVAFRNDLPWAWGAGPETVGRSAAPSAGPSVEPARKLLFSDPLSRPKYWQASEFPAEKAACAFASNALVVQRDSVGSFRCKGPSDPEPDDLHVEVDTKLISKGACAAIWFRFRSTLGYQVRVCETKILVGTHKSAQTTVLKTFPLDDPVVIGGPATRITVIIRGDTVEIRRDGLGVGSVPLTDTEITSGRVLLGLFTEERSPDHAPPYAVHFQQVDIWSLTE